MIKKKNEFSFKKELRLVTTREQRLNVHSFCNCPLTFPTTNPPLHTLSKGPPPEKYLHFIKWWNMFILYQYPLSPLYAILILSTFTYNIGCYNNRTSWSRRIGCCERERMRGGVTQGCTVQFYWALWDVHVILPALQGHRTEVVLLWPIHLDPHRHRLTNIGCVSGSMNTNI